MLGNDQTIDVKRIEPDTNRVIQPYARFMLDIDKAREYTALATCILGDVLYWTMLRSRYSSPISYSFLATQRALEEARHSPLPYAMTYHFLAIPFTVLHESQAV